ncbi:MAG: host attachment protein [Rhodospirillales bacterium]|nr:host attachment protein [Rhodospirillales bacterium]
MARHRELLVVIADGEHARFLRWGEGVPRAERAFDSSAAHARSSELVSDRPGASFHSGASARHAAEPRHDPHALAKEAFARLVAHEIGVAAASGSYDGVVLAAPARVLNTIRAGLDAAAAECIVGMLRKDLVKVPDAELEAHLRAVRLKPA